MKDFLTGLLGIGAGAIGCVVYAVFYSVMFCLMLWLGFTVITWIF